MCSGHVTKVLQRALGVVVVSQEWKLQLGCWEAAAEGGDRTEEPRLLWETGQARRSGRSSQRDKTIYDKGCFLQQSY